FEPFYIFMNTFSIGVMRYKQLFFDCGLQRQFLVSMLLSCLQVWCVPCLGMMLCYKVIFRNIHFIVYLVVTLFLLLVFISLCSQDYVCTRMLIIFNLIYILTSTRYAPDCLSPLSQYMLYYIHADISDFIVISLSNYQLHITFIFNIHLQINIHSIHGPLVLYFHSLPCSATKLLDFIPEKTFPEPRFVPGPMLYPNCRLKFQRMPSDIFQKLYKMFPALSMFFANLNFSYGSLPKILYFIFFFFVDKNFLVVEMLVSAPHNPMSHMEGGRDAVSAPHNPMSHMNDTGHQQEVDDNEEVTMKEISLNRRKISTYSHVLAPLPLLQGGRDAVSAPHNPMSHMNDTGHQQEVDDNEEGDDEGNQSQSSEDQHIFSCSGTPSTSPGW
ncbi:hypothetical protein L9F63_017212, partial [Diploptera punctata]